MVHCLELWASNAGGKGLIPGQGTRITQGCAAQQEKKKKKNQNPGLCFFTAPWPVDE